MNYSIQVEKTSRNVIDKLITGEGKIGLADLSINYYANNERLLHCGAKPGCFKTSNRVSEQASERTNERSGARKQSEQCGASE